MLVLLRRTSFSITFYSLYFIQQLHITDYSSCGPLRADSFTLLTRLNHPTVKQRIHPSSATYAMKGVRFEYVPSIRRLLIFGAVKLSPRRGIEPTEVEWHAYLNLAVALPPSHHGWIVNLYCFLC